MRINVMEGQVSLFVQDSPVGKTYPALTHHALNRRPPEAISGRSSSRSSPLKNPLHTLMLLDLRPGAGNMLGPYWEYDPPWLGSPGTLNCSACPKGVIGSSLSLILEDSVPQKYYLSRKACRGILRRARERGKPLPVKLEVALRLQAGLPVQDDLIYELTADGSLPLAFCLNHSEDQTRIFMAGEKMAFAANQRDEVRDLHDCSGALGAQPGMKQQTFVAAPSCLNPWDKQQARVSTPEGVAPTLVGSDGGGGRNPGGLVYTAGFNAGAGSKAGSISYHEDFAPTLKAAQSGNLMLSVLCLNDQGGSIMDCTENLSGTLRAQEHGHQPLVLYDNHGIDARYTGPHEIAPTMSAAYGSGGNNVPLVSPGEVESILFSRQRVDQFQESPVASTESARQHKDATDLVYQETVGALTRSDSKGINNQYVSQDKCVVDSFFLIRRLTPRECERLQGYPDDWMAIPGASDAARYRALGNSVAIPCVEYLMQGIALLTAAGL